LFTGNCLSNGLGAAAIERWDETDEIGTELIAWCGRGWNPVRENQIRKTRKM
jgi:hypothetical protein